MPARFRLFRSADPRHRPDDIWRRAEAFVTAGCRPSLACDGPATFLAWRYLQSQTAPPACQRYRRRLPQHAVITAALEIYTADDLRRSILEARILSGQSLADVASAESLPASVVDIYARLFFDIHSRRQAVGWIHNYAINRSEPTHSRSLGTVLRRMGYQGGPAVLEAAIAVVRSTPHLYPATLPDLATVVGRQELRVRLALLGEMVEPFSRDWRRLWNWQALLKDAERQAGQIEQMNSDIQMLANQVSKEMKPEPWLELPSSQPAPLVNVA